MRRMFFFFVFLYMCCNLAVVVVIYYPVITGLVFCDSILSSSIAIKVIIIAVQMIRRNIKEYAYFRVKGINMVQLEAADFQKHFFHLRASTYNIRKGISNISGSFVAAFCQLPGMVEPIGDGCFPIAARNGG